MRRGRAETPRSCGGRRRRPCRGTAACRLRLVEDRGDRVVVEALRLAHPPADADRLRHGEMDAPILDLAAGARRFAGRGDRAHLDADLAAGPLHPFPARRLRDDRLDAARVVERAGIGAQIADRDAGHLRLGIGAAHRVGIDDREPEMRRRHQRLDAVAAADLQRHDGAEFRRRIPPGSRRRGRCCGCRRGAPGRPAAPPCWRRSRPNRRRQDRAATSARPGAPRHKAAAC